MEIWDDDSCLVSASSKYFPHLSLLRRPYAELFERGGIVSENNECIAGITTEFFSDAFHFTQEANSQVVQPIGCYWSSPNFVGDRNWIFQWCMSPKNMHRYSYACELECECLELTFTGCKGQIWNKQKSTFEEGTFFALPIKWGLDNPETGPYTGRIHGRGYWGSRLLSIRFDDVNDYACHGGWYQNLWLSTNVVHGNVILSAHLFVSSHPFI